MEHSYLVRLQSYLEKLKQLQSMLAAAIEEADILSVDPYITGLPESHTQYASRAVVSIGEQIQQVEDAIDGLQDYRSSEGYNTNPYRFNPSQDAQDKKRINKILSDLTPCDKKAWGLRRFNPTREAQDKKRINKIIKSLTPCDKKAWGLRRFNPTQDARDKKKINEILGDLTPCDKKDWGLKRFRHNPMSDSYFNGRKIKRRRRVRQGYLRNHRKFRRY